MNHNMKTIKQYFMIIINRSRCANLYEFCVEAPRLNVGVQSTLKSMLNFSRCKIADELTDTGIWND